MDPNKEIPPPPLEREENNQDASNNGQNSPAPPSPRAGPSHGGQRPQVPLASTHVLGVGGLPPPLITLTPQNETNVSINCTFHCTFEQLRGGVAMILSLRANDNGDIVEETVPQGPPPPTTIPMLFFMQSRGQLQVSASKTS